MIYNEDTYYIGYHRNVRELGAVPALVFDTICGLLNDASNINGSVSNTTLCELLAVTPQYLRTVISKLIKVGYIEKVAGNGRGNSTTYILTEKGKQNAPLYTEKRGNKTHYKGETKRTPLNKELNKEKNNLFIMVDFEKFWSLFSVDADHENERERCERLWYVTPDETKQSILRDLEDSNYHRNTQSPFVFLKYYKEPLRFVRQGTKAFEHWREDNLAQGKRMCLLLFDGRAAYCLEEDMQKMIEAGAQLINGDWK